MSRPSRLELLRKFFPELGRTAIGGETEAAIAINTRACEVILADLIKRFDEAFAIHGPGVLHLNLALQESGGRSTFVVLDDLCADLIEAERYHDYAISGMLRDVISTVGSTNYGEHVLVLLTDRSSSSLLPIPRDNPARGVQNAQEEATL